MVLLGEASHGTSEFYRARAAISRRLIERHGFNIVAVEADWPDAATSTATSAIGRGARRDANAFERFPTWMWRNTDVDAFIRWMRGHNAGRAQAQSAASTGSTCTICNGSIRAVIDFLEKEDPEARPARPPPLRLPEPWADNPQIYGQYSLLEGYARCEVGVVQMLKDLLQRQVDCFAGECDEWLDAAANARLVKDAEAYYRVMYHGSAASWNLRDTHMFETLNMILDAKGADSKAIVWAHNSHIGNAAFTDMGMHRDELNIGQLAKEKFRDKARADRVRDAQRHGRGGRRLGPADEGQAGQSVAAREP